MSNIEMKQAREMVKDGEAVKRLLVNRDFIRVVTKGYLEKESSRLVGLIPEVMQGRIEGVSREVLDAQMASIGLFANYINSVRGRAEMASQSIADYENGMNGEEDE